MTRPTSTIAGSNPAMYPPSETYGASATRSEAYRWGQLLIGIVCMAMIANLQYGWTLFVNPIADKHGWSRAAIQVAFTIFVLTETWLVPIEGYLVDRFGPRAITLAGEIGVMPAYRRKSGTLNVRMCVRPWTNIAATRRASCDGFPVTL